MVRAGLIAKSGGGNMEGMKDESQSEDDREAREMPPVVEHFPSVRRIVRWLTEGEASPPPAGEEGGQVPAVQPNGYDRNGFSLEDHHEFRPTLRPPVPVLTVLDDGSRDVGEDFRLRGEKLTIGRTSGDVMVPNDPSISGAHAEIRRTPWKGGFQWHLHDLDSVNGTFVRCVRAVLHENAVVILGSRRFRLKNPLKPSAVATAAAETRLVDGEHIPETVWPVLMESSGKANALQFPLRSGELAIGRTGGGADIQLDDPLLAYNHASLKRMRDGTWMIVSETTRNGIWVSISAVSLSAHCFFRCGEQRFRFVIP
jgi:hypothetical protein